jgi:Cys-tRNA(Pro) deacylase
MPKDKHPTTQAVRFLKEKRIPFVLRLYNYEEKGGTKVAARELGVDEHQVVKTLVMEDDKGSPLLILMHGDQEVSTKSLARILNVKTVTPCTPEGANKHTGYIVGGISPFGTRKTLRVYVEASILDTFFER